MPLPDVPTFVLDTNLFRGGPVEQLAAIRAKGHRVRVSDIALLETIARSVREYQSGRPRRAARGLIFSRARALAPFIDESVPVAASGGQLVRLVIAEADGGAPAGEDVGYVTHLADVWRRASGTPGMTDEEWIDAGAMAEAHLTGLDGHLSDLARPEAELLKNPLPADVTPEEYARSLAHHNALSDAEKLEALKAHVRECLRISSRVAERFDAYVSTLAIRLHLAGTGARAVTTNDGADGAMLQHLAAGCILLSNDGPLIDLVDNSGTFQRPWVRRFNDLENLPDGPPWGEDARRQAESFQRA